MAKVCEISGKRKNVKNNVSHSKRRTKGVQYPNLQKLKVVCPKTGVVKKMKISTSALRTLNKKMRQAA